MSWYSNDWPPYVPVAERRRQAAKQVAKMKRAGEKITPVEIAGRKITTTFWGNAWCKNLEAYSDYANRLPRGRTYVRNGSVIDLQIENGQVHAQVSGSEIYRVEVEIKSLAERRWTDIKHQCGGQIGSLVELLQGRLSKGVMEIVTRKGEGLFPSPQDISLYCSCPDWATMCKHVAATLYGVGARIDHEPELLFILRGVNSAEMVDAVIDGSSVVRKTKKRRSLSTDELSSVFGVDIDMDETAMKSTPTSVKKKRPAQIQKKPIAKTSKISKVKSAPKKKTVKKATSVKSVAKKKAVAKRTSRKQMPAPTKKRTKNEQKTLT